MEASTANPNLPRSRRTSKTEPEKYYVIEVAKAKDKHEANPVPLSHNGYQFKLLRGHLLPVPERVLNVLNDAKEPEYVQEEGQVRKTGRWIHRYPYSIIFRDISSSVYEQLKVMSMDPAREKNPITQEEIQALIDAEKASDEVDKSKKG